MAVVENTYALTSLEAAMAYLGLSAGHAHQALILQGVNAVSSRMEGRCGRNFRSRTYTCDGTARPRLDSDGTSILVLKNRPVTSVASLKLYPGSTALTEGYSGDFVVLNDEGIIQLNYGTFYDGRRIVEITYTAGFLDTLSTGQPEEWGWTVGAAAIERACIQQVAYSYNKMAREKDGIASRSSEGVTVTYLNDPWLPEVEEILASLTVPL